MKISFNPSNSNKNILDLIKNNKDIIFDLKGHSIFARGVEFKGTDTNTWRPVVDNLTSDSTTSSLSAKQGKVLKALIDGKSNSDHNHDGRYVRYYAVTTLDCNNLAAGLTAARISATNAAHTNHSAYLYISDVGTPFQIQIPDSSIPYIYKRYYGSGKWSGWFKLNAGYADSAGSVAWANITGKPSSYTPSAHTHDDRYLRLTGGWMSGDINFGGDNKIHWGRNTDSASISFKNDGDGDANSYMSFVTSDNGNEYFRWSHSSGSTNTEWMALRGDGLRVRGTKVSLEGHSHNDLYYTKAESNAKYITDITTSVNKLTFTKNGSNIIRDITVNVVHSQGCLTNIPNKDATTKASPGLFIYDSYNQTIGTNPYSSVLSINTGGTIQIAGNWGDDQTRNLYWRSQSDRNVADYPWKSWRTILDSENYSFTLDSRYYTESEVNSLLSRKLDRVNLTTGSWNPRGYHLAADYHYNGGDLSISESGGKIHVSVDGYFWQNEGQYRVLDTSDVAGLKSNLTVHQYLSATDAAWYPLVWGGNAHLNTSDSTGAVYKSYDKLSWQTSSQTLYATNIQTNNIKNLSIGGGIYWNPNVESASDGSDAASITLVRSGVAGGTTLVLSQMNDTNDTIQFKTNTAARLYHNNYPILTTQNTYVSNNKGYINGTEITQVSNADKVDNRHAISTTPNTGIIYKAAIYTAYSLTSYWVRLASIPSISQNGEFVATIHVQSGHSGFGRNAILLVYLRGGASSYLAKGFNICCNSNYDPIRFRLYYKDSDKTSEIWYNTVGQWDGIITTVISQSSEGSLYEGLTLYSGVITAVQTPSMSTYLSAQVSTITDNISGNASTASKWATARTLSLTGSITGSVSFDGSGNITLNTTYGTGNITNLDSRYVNVTGDTMTGTLTTVTTGNNSYNQGIRINRTATNQWATLLIGKSGTATTGTGTSTAGDGAWLIATPASSNSLIFNLNSASETVGLCLKGHGNTDIKWNNNTIWHAGNDGSGSGLDADTVDGYHESSFLRYRGSYEDASVTKDGVGVYGWDKNNTGFHESYGDIINIQGHSTWRTRFDIGTSGRIRIVHGINTTTATQVGYLAYLHDNVASATNAYHLRINSANTWSTWYWAGQSGQPNWLWGSNDGTNMYVWNPNNFNVNTAQYLRSLGNQNCQTGRTQAYGDVYTYNTYNDNTGSPTTYSSVIGFGRGIAGTVEIAGGWCNTHLYWRSLRDCCEDWFPWRTVLDSSNYTEFINNYYWANVKISAFSSTTTSPTFSNVYLGNSLYLNNRGSNSIYNGPNDSANGVGGPLNNLVFSSWQGVSFTTSCAGLTYTNKNAVSINCRTGQLYAREVQANGFMHTGHNNNDAVLLAGGGYKTLKDFIFLNKSYNYTDNEHYNLNFHKLSGICNNLVWVDGHVKGSITKNFAIDPAVFPYHYDEDPSLNTIYRMTGNNYITINAIGIVTINNATDHKQRVGFFYTGRA